MGWWSMGLCTQRHDVTIARDSGTWRESARTKEKESARMEERVKAMAKDMPKERANWAGKGGIPTECMERA